MKKRMLSQDIAKGMAILAVVQLHTIQVNMAVFYFFSAFLAFAMPFFIFMSGYNYRPKGLKPVEAMKQRVLAILKVYAVWTLGIFVVMGAYFLIRGDASPAEILKSFAAEVFSESGCRMIGWNLPVALFQHVLAPYWFLQYLITASVLFYLLVDYALRSVKNLFSLVILLSGITFAFVCLGIELPWGLHCAPLLAAVMMLGAKLGEDNRFFAPASKVWLSVLNAVVCLVIVDLIQISFPAAGILGSGRLGDVAGGAEVLFVLCFGVFGSFLLIHIGKLLDRVPVVSTALIWCGQHSLLILLMHRPIAYVIRDVMGLPHFISGNPLYVDHVTLENVIACLLVYAVMVPVIMGWDRLKARRRKQA